MDLKRMLYFCTIAEQGQVSRAARVLNMAQPPLSQRLRELESDLGCELFARRGRSLQLTEAGKLFYQRAREILRAVEATRDEVIRVASQSGPALRIGLSPTCRSYWPAYFQRFRAHLPERVLGLIVADSSYLEYLLQTGQLDLALMQPPLHPENFMIHALATSETVAVVPEAFLDASVQTVSLTDLGAHPLLLLRRSVGVGSYERLLQRLHEKGKRAQVALYSSDVAVLLDSLALVEGGIAVLPASETGAVTSPYRVLPIEVDLPGFCFSLVYPCGGENATLFQQIFIDPR